MVYSFNQIRVRILSNKNTNNLSLSLSQTDRLLIAPVSLRRMRLRNRAAGGHLSAVRLAVLVLTVRMDGGASSIPPYALRGRRMQEKSVHIPLVSRIKSRALKVVLKVVHIAA